MRTQLNGYVVADDELWLYDFFDIPAFSPQTVRTALEAVPPGDELILEINSGGGSVFAGFEMYSVLRSAQLRTVAEVQSLAASAASVLMLGCDVVQASPVAQIMIHLPSVRTEGDRSAHFDSIEVLDSITESILNAYTIKCAGRTTRDDLRLRVEYGTWMTTPEAKSLGLIDSIVGEGAIDPTAILNCVGDQLPVIRSMATAAPPSPAALRAEYDRLVQAGEAPPKGGRNAPSSKVDALDAAKAALELEKLRFY